MNRDQYDRIRTGKGFIAALDQSGGSTPKTLERYGIAPGSWKDEAEMFDLIHQMRVRIMTSPAFTGDRIIGAILFEMTMEREVAGKPTARYLWEDKKIVPFVKVDKGLAAQVDGVQLMKPIEGLDELLARARAHGIFGTKMRSVIHEANADGIAEIVTQQFDVGARILEAGLMPIIEPEVDIHAPDKARAEEILRERLFHALDGLAPGQQVMFKLSLPEVDNFYLPLIEDERVLRVVALSGGYSRDEANARLARNKGMIASFSRALTEGLRADQSDEEFNAALGEAIQSIYEASVAG